MLNIQEKVSLAPMTTFRIGGGAEYFVQVQSLEDLKEAIKWAQEKKLEFVFLGGGSNILFSDNGYRGLVIQLKLSGIEIKGNEIMAEAGVPLIKLINSAAGEGLSGMEGLAGIPGTVGGAVRGNAGAYGSATGNSVKEVQCLDVKTGELKNFSKQDCGFDYRSSVFKNEKNLVVVSAVFEFEKKDKESVTGKTKETIMSRISKELQGEKSAGSFFMNPVVEDENLRKEFEKDRGVAPKDDKLPAGWLIDQVNLRGKKMGGAMISEKHSNYLINTGDATAEDVIMLSSFVKQQVRDKTGVQLQEEVSYLGF